jgi:hypothetical protein
MNPTKIASIGLAAALAALLPAIPAQADGASRTFVSAAGSDSNNCANVVTPCRHFAAAYAATAPSGEIFVLDPANYGSLTGREQPQQSNPYSITSSAVASSD